MPGKGMMGAMAPMGMGLGKGMMAPMMGKGKGNAMMMGKGGYSAINAPQHNSGVSVLPARPAAGILPLRRFHCSIAVAYDPFKS